MTTGPLSLSRTRSRGSLNKVLQPITRLYIATLLFRRRREGQEQNPAERRGQGGLPGSPGSGGTYEAHTADSLPCPVT